MVLDAKMARIALVERGSCLPVSLASTQNKKRLCGGCSRKETAHVLSWHKNNFNGAFASEKS